MTNQSQTVATQAQANREVEHGSTMTSRLRDFTTMNPPMFYGSKMNEDPKDLVDKVYKILYAIGLTSNEKADLASYKHKDVSQTCYTLCRDNKS